MNEQINLSNLLNSSGQKSSLISVTIDGNTQLLQQQEIRQNYNRMAGIYTLEIEQDNSYTTSRGNVTINGQNFYYDDGTFELALGDLFIKAATSGGSTGGSGNQNLEQVTANGNTTTEDMIIDTQSGVTVAGVPSSFGKRMKVKKGTASVSLGAAQDFIPNPWSDSYHTDDFSFLEFTGDNGTTAQLRFYGNTNVNPQSENSPSSIFYLPQGGGTLAIQGTDLQVKDIFYNTRIGTTNTLYNGLPVFSYCKDQINIQPSAYYGVNPDGAINGFPDYSLDLSFLNINEILSLQLVLKDGHNYYGGNCIDFFFKNNILRYFINQNRFSQAQAVFNPMGYTVGVILKYTVN